LASYSVNFRTNYTVYFWTLWVSSNTQALEGYKVRRNRRDELKPASGKKAWKRVLTMKDKNLVFENRTKIQYLQLVSMRVFFL